MKSYSVCDKTRTTVSESIEIPVVSDYVKSESVPQIIREIEKSEVDGICLRKVIFLSHVFDGINSEVYGIIASPKEEGHYPAIQFFHGGGGNAERDKAIEYAKAGYIILVQELPGICNREKTPYTNGPWRERFKDQDEDYFNLKGDITNTRLHEALIAAVRGFYLLRSLPWVNKEKMGIMGISWGGYTTTMLSALLGDRVKAAFAIFGSGFYDYGSFFKPFLDKLSENDRQLWLKTYDVGRHCRDIKAQYFVNAATNDTYFWPPAVMATLGEIPDIKNQCFGPNLDHEEYNKSMHLDYFDYHLKDKGVPFPFVNVINIKAQEKTVNDVHFKVNCEGPIDSTVLYYSFSNVGWTERTWLSVDAVLIGRNEYKVVLDKNIVNHNFDWYVLVKDRRGITVSSLIYSG